MPAKPKRRIGGRLYVKVRRRDQRLVRLAGAAPVVMRPIVVAVVNQILPSGSRDTTETMPQQPISLQHFFVSHNRLLLPQVLARQRIPDLLLRRRSRRVQRACRRWLRSLRRTRLLQVERRARLCVALGLFSLCSSPRLFVSTAPQSVNAHSL